jgi:hypothetical protein
MKMRFLLYATLAATFMSGGSTIVVAQQVSVNYNHSQDFSGFHTYTWASNNANQIQNSSSRK